MDRRRRARSASEAGGITGDAALSEGTGVAGIARAGAGAILGHEPTRHTVEMLAGQRTQGFFVKAQPLDSLVHGHSSLGMRSIYEIEGRSRTSRKAGRLLPLPRLKTQGYRLPHSSTWP